MSASITSQARRGLRWVSLPIDVTPDALSHTASWPAFVTPMPPSQNTARAPECDIISGGRLELVEQFRFPYQLVIPVLPHVAYSTSSFAEPRDRQNSSHQAGQQFVTASIYFGQPLYMNFATLISKNIKTSSRPLWRRRHLINMEDTSHDVGLFIRHRTSRTPWCGGRRSDSDRAV